MCNEVRAALCVIVIRGIEHRHEVPGCHVLSFLRSSRAMRFIRSCFLFDSLGKFTLVTISQLSNMRKELV